MVINNAQWPYITLLSISTHIQSSERSLLNPVVTTRHSFQSNFADYIYLQLKSYRKPHMATMAAAASQAVLSRQTCQHVASAIAPISSNRASFAKLVSSESALIRYAASVPKFGILDSYRMASPCPPLSSKMCTLPVSHNASEIGSAWLFVRSTDGLSEEWNHNH